MAILQTYESITSTNCNGIKTATISSIPQTFTDLRIITPALSTGIGAIQITLNGSATGYAFGQITLGTYMATTVSFLRNGGTATSIQLAGSSTISLGGMVLDIFNYTDTTNYKAYAIGKNTTGSGVGFQGGQWASTSAVTSITVTCGNNMSGYLSIYGIKKA